jgi:hypothetical protein
MFYKKWPTYFWTNRKLQPILSKLSYFVFNTPYETHDSGKSSCNAIILESYLLFPGQGFATRP